jgi:3-deoxy-D-manno-octulosonate 8-phosphate phosphatase (KDO 8-P phosphatase)
MANDDAYNVHAGARGFPSVEAYRAIKLVIFDVDGVLTDGRIIWDSNGVETKFFNVRDGAGIAFLNKTEIKVALITGRSSVVVDNRARELKIPPERVKQGAKVKLPVFEKLLAENNLSASEAAFVGDDIIDLPVLERAGLACCPADAHPDVLKTCHVVGNAKGGKGGVRGICEHILKQRDDGTWEKAIDRYLGRAE